MSQWDVERVLGRLLTDQAFRTEFFQNPDVACLFHGMRFAPHEMKALLRVPRPLLANLSSRLDDRICRFSARRSTAIAE